MILPAVLAAAALALLAAGCGGGGSPAVARVASSTTSRRHGSSGNSASAPGNRALAYSGCMRSHGVLEFPDPSSSGGIDKSKVTTARSDAGSARFDAALNACGHLRPASPPGPSRAEVQQVLNAMTNFARCVRSHGVADWPDPDLDVGRPTFDIHGIDYQASRISAAIHGCLHLMPGSTQPRMCSALLAQQNGGAPGDEACFGGSPRVP